MVQRGESNRRKTENISFIVSDCATIYATARAAGVEMVPEVAKTPCVGESPICRVPKAASGLSGNAINSVVNQG
jgi:hypothetical protein